MWCCKLTWLSGARCSGNSFIGPALYGNPKTAFIKIIDYQAFIGAFSNQPVNIKDEEQDVNDCDHTFSANQI